MFAVEVIVLECIDNSICNNLRVDNETQFVYLSSDEERKIIQTFGAYLCETFDFVEVLEKEGPDGKILPMKPRKDLTCF